MPAGTLAAVLAEVRTRLESAGFPTAALDARLLLTAAANISHEKLIAAPDMVVAPDVLQNLDAMTARRLRHEPVSRILGEREFYGRRFKVTPQVLDPRPDTELLVDIALEIARRQPSGVRIADPGTGSGAIIVTLMAELPGATGLASDKSAPALKVSKANAAVHGVDSRITFVEADWLGGVDGEFDIIVSNPPYIETGAIDSLAPEVTLHDPRPALDGGADGLDAYRSLLPQALPRLAPGGSLCLEVGAEQAMAVLGLAKALGFAEAADVAPVHQDLAGRDRVVVVSRRFHNATQ